MCLEDIGINRNFAGLVSEGCHLTHGSLTRYEKLCVAHALGMPEAFFPATAG